MPIRVMPVFKCMGDRDWRDTLLEGGQRTRKTHRANAILEASDMQRLCKLQVYELVLSGVAYFTSL